VVLDAKEPLEVAATKIAEHQELGNRITLREDDMLTAELGCDWDAVLISGVVLIKSEAECRAIFRRAFDALAPGGLIIVQDFMRIDHSPRRQLLDTMMDLYVLVGFDPGASDRYGSVYATWLKETGFENPTETPLPTQLAIMTAERPMTST